MEIAKALILAGPARDPRAWSTTRDEPRHLFPVANRPILFHNLAALRAAGVLETTILADRRAAVALKRAVGDGHQWGLSVRYAALDPEAGVAGALAAEREFIGEEPVLVQQGDALLRERLHPHISAFARENLDALELRLSRPDVGPADPAPWHLFSPRASSLLHGCEESVAGMRERGGRVRVQLVDGCVPCQGDLDALLEGNRHLLEGLTHSVDPATVDQCTIQGAVEIHPTARLRRTLVRGPVSIGAGAQVSDAYIGPYTSIGAGAVIEGSEIEHSIVLPDAELRFVGTRLESSLIGRRARMVRGFDAPRAMRVSIGDGAEVVIP
jgi:glucose-1-phosphate thymidylyltransferase